MTYLHAYILMPMPWFQCLGFDTLIPMLYESKAIRQVWCWSPNNVKRQCLKTWFLRLLGLIFSLKVSSWKVSVPEKKKKVKLYLYSHHFLWFHITHYLTNTWQKNIHVCMFFFRGSLLCEWTQKSWTTPVKVYQWINDYFIHFLGHYRLE